MKIYTEITITPHHSGFGMFQAGEKWLSPEYSWVFERDLLEEMVALTAPLPLRNALSDPEFVAAGVEDISGRIYGDCGEIYARINLDGSLSYFGVVEDEVEEDFWAR